MNPWLAGLGAGLQSAGQSAMQLLAREQARREREQERTRLETLQNKATDRANRQFDAQMSQFAFQNNLMPYEQAEAPVKQAETIGSTLSSFRDTPMFGMGLGGAGDAISELAKRSRAQMARGRTLELPTAEGATKKYYQPYEFTKQGLEETERTRMKQALKAAGFSDQEADAIASSPEKLQSALLERIRPTAKGQPQEIVAPDGRVTFVQPPVLKPGETWDSGLTQRTPPAPGTAPYNWQVVTDPGTGTVYQVDPRTGQVRPTQAPTGDGPFQTTSTAKADAAKARERLRMAITRARELVNQYGIEVMPGEAQDQLSAAFTNLQLQYKDAAGLGALTGPDMGLIERALGDPTSITQYFRGGSKGVLAKLNEAERALAGQAAPSAGAGAGAGAGTGGGAMQLTPQEQAIYDAAKRENKSDAEIMAFIQKLRGGGL